MTPRQLRFVEAYVDLRNGRQAALRAGYSASCAEAMASRLLRNPAVIAALRERGVEVAFAAPRPGAPARIVRPLTERQTRFVEHQLILGNATEAARRAGYSARSAYNLARIVMKQPQVAEALRAATEARAQRCAITADRVLAEFARIAFAEIGRFASFGPEGLTLKPDHTLGANERAAVAELFAAPGKHGVTTRVRLFDKQRALENLAKHLGLDKARPAPEVVGSPLSPELRAKIEKIRLSMKAEARSQVLAELRQEQAEKAAKEAAAATAEGSAEPRPDARAIAAPTQAPSIASSSARPVLPVPAKAGSGEAAAIPDSGFRWAGKRP